MKRHKQHTSPRVGRSNRRRKEREASRLEALPEGALFVIAERLAQVEPGGVRGPSLAARDLCCFGLVSERASTWQCAGALAYASSTAVLLLVLLLLLLLLRQSAVHCTVTPAQVTCQHLWY
jgi:hypothetical protein